MKVTFDPSVAEDREKALQVIKLFGSAPAGAVQQAPATPQFQAPAQQAPAQQAPVTPQFQAPAQQPPVTGLQFQPAQTAPQFQPQAPASFPGAQAPVQQAPPSGPQCPLTDQKQLTEYVMATYQELGQRGNLLQECLMRVGAKNVNEVRPENYQKFWEVVEQVRAGGNP